MNRYLIALLALFAFFVCANSTHAQSKVLTEAAPAAGGFSAARLARLDSGMKAWVDQKWVNGSAILIARHGKIVFYKAHGYNDPATKAPLEKTGIFRIASQTKALTVVSVMMLWEEGKFSLDDPVSKFIPSFANEKVLASFNPKDTTYTTVRAKRQITIRDLLTHTSGIGYPGIVGLSTPAENALYGKSAVTGGVATKGQKLSDAMNRLGSLPLFFQPGEQWRYGLNMDLLGCLIEKWSGMSLEDFFETRICKPLGMKDTWFNLPAEKSPRLVNFFIGDSTGNIRKTRMLGPLFDMNYPLQKTDYFSGGGGLSSTLYDYAVFLQMLLNGGEYNGVRLLARNTVRLMTMNQIGDLHPTFGDHADVNKFGFGFFIISEEGSKFSPSQAGTYNWGGVFSTSYWVDPKEDMIVLAYEQMWGPYVANTAKALKPLVYGAIGD
ncbi:MAG TPA: serine hydrolase domain-containing protein [Mucilaginibacter sp.]|jgi:CubicO group peptidase (beta-lactamase class C family)